MLQEKWNGLNMYSMQEKAVLRMEQSRFTLILKRSKRGDEAKIKVSLEDPTGEFEEIFWVKVSEPKAPSQSSPKPEKKEIPTLGLPT